MSPPSRRTRSVDQQPEFKGRWKQTLSNGQVGYSSPDHAYSSWGKISGTQVTESEGHPFYSIYKRGQLAGDVGGNFYTTKQYTVQRKVPRQLFFASRNGETLRYEGPILAMPNGSAIWNTAFPPALNSSYEKLNELGTIAIARCKPTNSVADASVFLGELIKDGVPSAVGSKFWKDSADSNRKRGADEYLNWKFGWEPVISDIRKFAEAARTADAVISQYERDAGRLVRRRYNFPVTRKTTQEKVWSGVTPQYFPRHLTVTWGLPTGDIYRTRELVQRQWFSGAFTYAMPDGNSSRRQLTQVARWADKLLGLSLTPDTVWNLSPWSWAADWVTNAGDVLSNISDYSVHGLLMRYGYIMEHTVVRDTYTFESTTSGFGSSKIHPSPLIFVTETKVRRRASPFGFGVTWEGLSPTQLSILAALGFSRGK